MARRRSLKLELVSEQNLSQAIIPGLVSYCPSMDLIALGTIDNQVQIYRLNGQEVYKSNQKNNTIKIQSLAWKPSGQLLATAWSDGTVKLVGAESTKIVHQFKAAGESGINHLAWASSLTRTTSNTPARVKGIQSWNELLAQDNSDSGDNYTLDLPRDLSQIDIETSLPKLSVLASGGTSEDVFSSRASLDALFRPFDTKDVEAVDVMVVDSREGNLHLSIYDSFVIGTFASPSIIENTSSKIVSQASHHQYSTYSLLLKSPEPANRLFLVPMDLRFVSSSGDYLSLLASRSSALQNLLRYVHEVHRLMVAEWESTRDLPSKFLRNIDEDLQGKEGRNIVQALYHSVVTGHTFPTVKEWLVDELAERGHKRWDKAVVSGLQNLKQLVHENMLPALDRCSVILSRFAGIIKFRGSNDTLGFNSQQISLLHDNVACIHLVSSKILTQAVDELELFTAFSAWLRYEIDRLASEGSSTIEDDAAEKESTLDHTKVLQYIQTALKRSTLANYLGKDGDDGSQDGKQGLLDYGAPMFDVLSKQIQKMERGQQYPRRLLKQACLTESLSNQARQVFQQIAEAEKRNVLFGDSHEIGVLGKEKAVDVKVDPVDSTTFKTYIAYIDSKMSNTLQITRATLSIEKGISKTILVESANLQLGNGEIGDIKFYGNSVFVLWSANDTPILLEIPYKSASSSAPLASKTAFELRYSQLSPGGTDQEPQDRQSLTNEEVRQLLILDDTFIDEDSFVAGKIKVREESKGRNTDGDNSGRIVLVAQNGLKYRVYQVVQSSHGHVEEDVEMSQEV